MTEMLLMVVALYGRTPRTLEKNGAPAAMLKKCIVPCCDNNTQNAKNKIFLTVPTNPERRAAWFEAIGYQGEIPQNRSLYCCEDHFDLQQDSLNWMRYKMIGRGLQLKSSAVPHLHLRSPHPDKVYSQLTNSAKKRKAETLVDIGRKKIKKVLFHKPVEVVESEEIGECVAVPAGEPIILGTPLSITQPITESVSSMDKETQTDKSVHTTEVATNTVRVRNVISPSDTEICEEESDEVTGDNGDYLPSSASGTSANSEEPTYDVTYRRVSSIKLTEVRTRFYSGLPKTAYLLVKFTENYGRIPYADILITLRKIRLDDVYVRLADDFDMSVTGIQKLFTRTVPKLATVLQTLIFWPESRRIIKNLPIPFRARYRRVESIIDCFEIEIEKPSDPVKQAITWSEYKKCNTLKFLISSTPSGFVNYISGGFGGRITDKQIIEDSDYLQVLPNRVDVMADRGFKHIFPLLHQKQCNLIRPPSLMEGDVLTKDLAKENKRIAALRIHIERVIRRLREFRMLVPHSCINKNLMYLMNHIIIIACAIVNVQGPLII